MRRPAGVALLAVVIVGALGLRLAPVAQAQPIGTKTCASPGGSATFTVGDSVTCTLVLTGSATDIPAGSTITIAAGTNYSFIAAQCTSTPGTCSASQTLSVLLVTCSTNPCTRLTITETLTITSSTPSTITQQVTVAPPAPATPTTITVTFTPVANILFASPDGTGNCESADSPCTIFRALEISRDGDTISLLAGTYLFSRPAVVTKLVTIEPNSGAKAILKAVRPVSIFDVTAQGGPNLHVIIRNLQIGGCTPPRPAPTPIGGAGAATTPGVTPCTTRTAATAAFRLIDDNYTEINNNIIGAEDLPIDNGIVLSNSDHTNIHDNTIQGNSRFVFTPILSVGHNQTGFGIVTFECLGGFPTGVSDSVTIKNNVFTNSWLAGIWMCSDGAGEHLIDTNTFRNNWRGIALKDVTDTTVSGNVLTDEKSDGIILYGATLRSTVKGNQVESHIAPAAAGIRIGWIADPIVPLSNTVTENKLLRDTIGLHIFGARTTVVTANQIKISGIRTAILITPSTFPGDPGTQPRDTEITGGNVIVFSGPCAAVIGCAIRLVGVTVPVLATDNDFGLRRVADVEGVIYHKVDDPALGTVTFVPFRNMVVEISPTPTPGISPAPPGGMPGSGSAPPSATPTPEGGPATGPMPGAPNPGSPPTPPTTGTPTAAALTSAGGTLTTTVSLESGCNTVQWPGPSDYSVVDAAMGLVPAAAQRSITIWRKDSGDWQGWGAAPGGPTDVFLLRRNDTLRVCVSQSAKWLVPTRVGGP